MDTKSVQSTTLQQVADDNEYKAAFIGCMKYIETYVDVEILLKEYPGWKTIIPLWYRTKQEEKDRIKASFERYLNGLTESERQILRDEGLIGEGYAKTTV